MTAWNISNLKGFYSSDNTESRFTFDRTNPDPGTDLIEVQIDVFSGGWALRFAHLVISDEAATPTPEEARGGGLVAGYLARARVVNMTTNQVLFNTHPNPADPGVPVNPETTRVTKK